MLSKLVVRKNRPVTQGGGGGNPSIPAYPTYTDYPTVAYEDLWAAAPSTMTMSDGTVLSKGPLSGPGSNVVLVLKSLSSRKYVVLPAKSGGVSWEGELIGNHDTNGMAVYAPNVMGIWCHPSDVPTVTFGPAGQIQISDGPKIRQKEHSAIGSQLTTGKNGGNALTSVMRIGPWSNNDANRGPTYMYGWTLEGTEQDIDPYNNQPRGTSGIVDYGSKDSLWQIFKVRGFIATWNAPPGETFQINSLYTRNCTYEFVETDGIAEDGERRGGAFGFFASNDIHFKDCYFHDARAGGWTGGASGNVGPGGTPSNNMTALRVYSWNNANYSTGSGQGFSCFNSEGVIGTALFTNCNFKPTWPKAGGGSYSNLVGFYSLLDDCQVTFVDTEWNIGAYNSSIDGAFGFDMPVNYAGGTNLQVTIPTFIKNGVTFTARPYSNASTYNPANEFVYDVS